tara:strand:+ start:25 stop:639 length:615 start_codon:yes stop_codon:yes gene_type:complete
MLITVLVGTLLSTPISADKLEIKYSDIVYQAINNCPGLSSTKVDQKLIWDLVKIENKYNPPKSLRGMLLAAACQESKYNPNAEGDRKFSKRRKPKAIGILQFWPWAKKYINRRDPHQSADFWMKRIVKQLSTSVKRNCKFRSKKRRWIAAWVTAIRYPKKGGRCYEKPKHYSLLKKWYRNIKKQYEYRRSCKGHTIRKQSWNYY